MKKQYLAQFQNRFTEKEGTWANAVWIGTGCKKRYASTLEEAQLYLDKAVKEGQDKATKWQHQHIANGIGISTEPNEDMLVTHTRIRVREVTEWEEV